MRKVAALTAIVFALAAAPAGAQDRPFVGEWDCEVATFVITEEIYNNGSEDLPIEEIQEGTDGTWTFLFADGYFFTVGDVTEDTMTWLSGESGDTFSCRRVN